MTGVTSSKVPTILLFGWACGALTTGALTSSVGLLHLRFMTDSLGMTAAVAGLLYAGSKIYDAFLDPIMGGLSDRTKSRWGARRPYLFVGAILCAASMPMLFIVPDITGTALVVYKGVTLCLYATAYTTFRIPFLAMAADLTRTFEHRSQLTNWNVWGSSFGSLAATSMAPFLLAYLGSDRRGHGITACLIGALILIAGLACFRATKVSAPVVTHAPPPRGVKAYLTALVDNRPFMALIAFKMIIFTAIGVHGVSVPFFVRHSLHLSDYWLGSLFLCQTAMMVLSQPLWRALARRWERRRTAVIATCVLMFAYMFWLAPLVMDPRVAVILIGVINGAGGGGMFFSVQSMLPDTIEYDRRRTGLSREGLFAGIFVMTEKITGAVAIALFGIAVGLLGYKSGLDANVEQSASVIMGIYALAAVIPCVMMLFALFVLRWYRLTETQLQAAVSPAPSPAT